MLRLELLRHPRMEAGWILWAAVDEATAVTASLLPRVGRLASAEPVDATLGMKVEKTGRATGYTTGIVHDVSADVQVLFDLARLTFHDQIVVDGDDAPFCDGGDSGSLVVDQDSRRVTGLLFLSIRREGGKSWMEAAPSFNAMKPGGAESISEIPVH